MHCLRYFAVCLPLMCLSAAVGEDYATQDISQTTTGSVHMETPAPLFAAISYGMDLSFLKTNIKRTMDNAIAEGELPGGVVMVLRGEHTAFLEPFGNRALEPEVEPTTVDTVYDLASLTKPIATATSIMQLVETGQLRLSDPIGKYIPEWKDTEEEESTQALLRKLEKAIEQNRISASNTLWQGTDKETNELLKATLPFLSTSQISSSFDFRPRNREAITIRHLLTHTAGLPSFLRYYEKFPEGNARKQIVTDIARGELRRPVGGQFIYSDLGFIVLGDLVERVSGMPLDVYSQKNIFEPLGMTDTMFVPPDSLNGRIAPTEWTASRTSGSTESTRTMIRGRVHDGNAFVQDGVSGHAGLFSTAEDLGKYFRLMMHGGSSSGPHILSPVTIEVMTQNHSKLGEEGPGRGLGWDLTSGYSGQKGDLLRSGYGHTGFTGTSVWIVPEEKLAIIILSNRVHPHGKGDVTPLRAKIANIVAGSIRESYRNETLENN